MKNLLRVRQGKWKPLSFVFFLQLVSVISLAQVSISGKVTGPDGNGIASISVNILNTGFGTASNDSGTYIRLLPAFLPEPIRWNFQA
jgi:hypothetical protein